MITMELVGEWCGLYRDTAIWKYFQRHWSHFFPAMPHRSQFVRQAAN